MIFYKEANFKETPIGKIPKTWQVVSIGDVCQQRNEIVQPSMNNKEPFVGLEHIASGETRLQKFAQSADVKSAKFRFYAGDILYGKLRPYLDKAVIAIFNGICSTDLLVLTPKENVVKEFLIYVLHSNDFIKYAIATTTGTNHPRTSWSAISKFKFGLPEYLEQQKIADILLTVDEAIQKTNEIIAKTERLKKGLMQELLTKGTGHREFKDTEIGRIPKDWEVVKLGEIGTFQYGITTSAKEEDTGLKLLRITDIRDDGTINWSEVPFCEISLSELSKYMLKVGDVLFARIGATTGKTCYINQEIRAVFGSYLIRFLPDVNSQINTKFLHLFTQSEMYWSQVNRMKGGQLKKGLNTQLLKEIKILLPPLEEQQKIAQVLSTVDKKLEIERNEKAKLEKIKQGLMDLLLTGKIRVKVNQLVP